MHVRHLVTFYAASLRLIILFLNIDHEELASSIGLEFNESIKCEIYD